MPEQGNYEQRLNAAVAQIEQVIADFFTAYPAPEMTPARITMEQQRVLNASALDWLRDHLQRADQGANPWFDAHEIED